MLICGLRPHKSLWLSGTPRFILELPRRRVRDRVRSMRRQGFGGKALYSTEQQLLQALVGAG